LRAQIKILEQEVGTELTSKLSDEEQGLLDDLKATQTRLDGDIEKCHSVLEEATIKRQNLTSLLEDNLVIRKNELTENSSCSPRAGGVGGGNSVVSQAKMKEELEQKRRELEEATQTTEEVERQLAEAKTIDKNLRSAIRELKNNFDKLKTQNAAYQKELDESHESQERLLNKVSVGNGSRLFYWSFFLFANQYHTQMN
jgi:DNA repair exonuclease SbcCD ATPase subunit